MKIAIQTGLFAVLGALAAQAAPAAQAQPLDEVQVEGQSMTDLRAGVTKAEKKFLALYNKLNKNGKYAVSCRDDASTGTRLAKRTCSSRAEDMAIADQARDFLGAVDMNASLQSAADGNASSPAAANAAATATSAAAALAPTPTVTGNAASAAPSDSEVAGAIRESRSQFDQNMDKLLAENADLRALMDEYVQARKRLEAARARQSAKQPG